MPQVEEKKTKKSFDKVLIFLSKLFSGLGVILILLGAVLFVLFFYPVLGEEIEYFFSNKSSDLEVKVIREENYDNISTKNILEPIDNNFGIVIPKIRANASVVPNVNPYDSSIYQKALTKGVAHAEGTVLPGQIGNIFIFSHSSVNFYEANRYNSVFYLLNKLKRDDEIYLTYNGKLFKYLVSEKKIVNSEQVEYFKGDPQKNTVTLMTCWPAGTTLKRLIVIGRMVEEI